MQNTIWILCLVVIALVFAWGIVNYVNSNEIIKNIIGRSTLSTQVVSPEKWQGDLNKLTDYAKNQFDANVVTFLITLLAVVVLTSSVFFLMGASKKYEETIKLQKEIANLVKDLNFEKDLKQTVCDAESLIFIIMSSELLIPKASSKDDVQTWLLNCRPYVQRAFSVPGFVIQRFKALSANPLIQSDNDLKNLHGVLMALLEERQDKASKKTK